MKRPPEPRLDNKGHIPMMPLVIHDWDLPTETVGYRDDCLSHAFTIGFFTKEEEAMPPLIYQQCRASCARVYSVHTHRTIFWYYIKALVMDQHYTARCSHQDKDWGCGVICHLPAGGPMVFPHRHCNCIACKNPALYTHDWTALEKAGIRASPRNDVVCRRGQVCCDNNSDLNNKPRWCSVCEQDIFFGYGACYFLKEGRGGHLCIAIGIPDMAWTVLEKDIARERIQGVAQSCWLGSCLKLPSGCFKPHKIRQIYVLFIILFVAGVAGGVNCFLNRYWPYRRIFRFIDVTCATFKTEMTSRNLTCTCGESCKGTYGCLVVWTRFQTLEGKNVTTVLSATNTDLSISKVGYLKSKYRDTSSHKFLITWGSHLITFSNKGEVGLHAWDATF